MLFDPRPYQVSLLDAIGAEFSKGHRRILAVAPTGSGKGVTIAILAHRAAAKGRRTLILAHRAELVSDLSARLTRCGVTHGVIASGRCEDPDQLVQVGSVQTVVRRLDRISAPDIIIQDEAHHLVAGNSWGRIIAHFPDALLIGKTATPERLDGKGLGIESGGYFDVMVHGPSAQWLTDEGYLARARVFCPPRAESSPKMRTRAGDYDMRDAAGAYGRPAITGDAIAHYRKHLDGRTAIVFCCSVQHARDVAGAFEAAGITSEPLDGTMSVEHRQRILNDLATGQVKIVTSCMIISEGTDVPSVGGCILLRPTQSLALHLQMIGRCLRPKADGSEAIILDHVGNVERHGFPTDVREWSLLGRDDRQRQERKQAPSVRTCPECYAALPGGTPVCPSCGHEFAPEVVAPEQEDGELVELAPKGFRPGDPVTIGGTSETLQALMAMNPDSADIPSGLWYIASRIGGKGDVLLARNPYDAKAVAAGRGQGISTYRAKSRWLSTVELKSRHRPPSAGAKTLQELQEIGRQRGYKPGWAAHIWAARSKR